MAQNITQEHFKLGTNIGPVSDPDNVTFGDLDTGLIDQAIDTPIHIRIQVYNSGDVVDPENWQLYYNTTNDPTTAGGATEVMVSSFAVKMVDDTDIANNTTLTGETIVFDRSPTNPWTNGLFADTSQFSNLGLAIDDYTDFQANIQFDSDSVGNTYYFFMRYDGSEIDNYPTSGNQMPRVSIGNIKGYEWFRSKDGGAFASIGFSVDGEETFTDDLSVLDNSDYTYQYLAFDNADDCSEESELSGTTTIRVVDGEGENFARTDPTDLKVTPIVDGAFLVTFNYLTDPNDIDISGFNIYRASINNPSDAIDEGDWVLDGSTGYNFGYGLYNYPSQPQAHDTLFAYRVFPVALDDVTERPNDDYDYGVADDEGPVVDNDLITTETI